MTSHNGYGGLADKKLWQEGGLRVNSSTYHWWAKVYDTGSEYGIDGGRVSKLMIKEGDRIAANYDRGWDEEPTSENDKLAVQIILHELDR